MKFVLFLDKEVFYETVRLRKKMSMSRLGYSWTYDSI